MYNKTTMKAISLFAGCGGDTLGLELAGYNVVAFSEFRKSAIESHLQNFPSSVHLKQKDTSDISKLDNSVFEPYRNTIDILFAGFPCQGFSKAGKKNITDPRNQMFRHFVRAADVIRPLYVIGENVTGLERMKSGPNEDDPMMLHIIQDAFRQIGYELTYKVLETVQFGVPQLRKRILLVGWDTRVISFDPPSFWNEVARIGKTEVPLKLRDFLRPTLEGAVEVVAVPEGFDDVCLSTMDMIPTGTPHPYLILKNNEKRLSCSKRDSPLHSEIIHPDKPSKTIICTYDHQPRLYVGLVNPEGKKFVRCLLPDELKQIQGFPATFQLMGNLKEQIVQVGNAVPPRLIKAVASALPERIA